ncbi:T9SS type A sorting domain-containing protein [Hymenobacter sp. BRD67]|uniref:T9SS type A sorting domain-containing protein n=1 Tax=Hymenobacter sp. BRD67 TaxID=2675877 RepID=UPI001563F63E|nr:T9SS type A sorting domain-containing protein [Hymenobacter sp. BRD67]QKG51766.1 T9SS type A sorting domain-containing protein [Hymenobacter sp. BRD67]
MLLQLPTSATVWAVRIGSLGMGSTRTQADVSADNGTTWQPAIIAGAVDFWAFDAQRAWLITDFTGATRLRVTTTGPGGFAVAPTQIPGTVDFIRFFSPTVGVAIDNVSAGATSWPIYRSTDGGQSWQLVTSAPALAADAQPSACTLLGNNLWVATTKGQLLLTANAGLTWTSASTPEPLTQVSFRDGQHGLAMGTSVAHLLYRTVDGGLTWTLSSPTGPRRLRALVAVPGTPGTYLSVGSNLDNPNDTNGTARSADDGQTWQDLGGTTALGSIVANSAGQAWVSQSYSGTLQRFAGAALPTYTAVQSVVSGVYPNPTTGRVQLPTAGAYRTVAVYDTTGHQCRTATLGATETALDLSSLGAGLYLLRWEGGSAAPQQQRLVVAP